MYIIKQLPEDFIVKEISDVKAGKWPYAYYILKKTSYTTIGALEVLSKKFRIPLKNFGFAGNKDKNAITEQKISILNGSRNFENAKLKGIELIYIANGSQPISLGDLKGNEFSITIRNLDGKDIKKIKSLEDKKIKVPNFFGPQRFSKNNQLVGKAIIKKDFRKAIGLILENKGSIEKRIKHYLRLNKSNYIEALRLIPLKTRRMFIHSYQSFLFNQIAGKLAKTGKNNLKIPLVGFDLELGSIKDRKLRNLLQAALEEEKIIPRDFIISQIPELTSQGGFRDLFFQIDGLRVIEVGNDELNNGKKKVKINFTLPKSCYATVALEYFFQ